MRKIIGHLKNHVKEDFHPITYGWLLIFLVTTISLNYYLNYELGILNSFYRQPISLLFYCSNFLFAYYAIAVPQLLILKKGYILKNYKYWLRSAFFICLVGHSIYFFIYKDLSYGDHDVYEKYFLKKVMTEIKSFILIFIPLFLFWFIIDRKKPDSESFYGLKLKNTNLLPYGIMLLIMTPLIFWASFQPDFQKVYPILKPWKLLNPFGLSDIQQLAIHEVFYGLSFLTVETLFRGALVIGMVKLVGKDAILPMVAMYAFLHFGKPLGETIGSVFGGYILGVIALRSKHIFGGVLIHIGVAYLMEATALWQHYFNQ